jgi:hypothetical protein
MFDEHPNWFAHTNPEFIPYINMQPRFQVREVPGIVYEFIEEMRI